MVSCRASSRRPSLADARRRPAPVRVPAARRGLGALLGADGRGRASGARRWRTPGSASSTTAPSRSRPTTSSSWARHPGLRGYFVGAGLQLRRHRLGRRCRAGCSPSGSPPGSRRRTWSPSTSAGSGRSTTTSTGCARGWPRCSGCTTRCRGRNREIDVRAGRSAARRCTSGWRTAAPGSAPGWGGSGRTCSRPRTAGSTYTWGKPPWLEDCVREQRACRTEVAVFDQTSFSKYAVSGPGALASLQRICAADVDVPVGRCVFTPWLNRRGTYEADLTVTRTADHEFLAGQLLGDDRARPRLAEPPRPGPGTADRRPHRGLRR